MKASGIVALAFIMTCLILGLYSKIGIWAIVIGVVEVLFQLQSFRAFRFLGSQTKSFKESLWIPTVGTALIGLVFMLSGLAKDLIGEPLAEIAPDEQYLFVLAMVIVIFMLSLMNERKRK